MPTDRKFAAFSKSGREGLGISEIPKDDFCISAFLVIREEKDRRKVLMGHLNPDEDWAHIGALTKDRIEDLSKGWMLPSCHLLYGESPQEAASRIASEQLGSDSKELNISEPKVYSEVYASKRFPEKKQHWDLEFIFEGQIEGSRMLQKNPKAWKKLEFIDIDAVNPQEIARSHEDILARVK